jgi:predicted O-methyltransferase YrrM
MTAIHPLADEILRTQQTELPDGSIVRADSYIARAECELIYRAVDAADAVRAIEIGMAYGVSSLCIADALSRRGHAASLISIDPNQSTQWRNAGVHLLRRARLGELSRVLEEPSQLALPKLVHAGTRVRFVLIDGWHTFDHTLVDFFFADQLLETGGVVVFDDVGYPAIRAVVRFVLANRDYELLEALPAGSLPARPLKMRRALKRALRPLARTDRDPSPDDERRFRALEDAFAVALRKRGEDTRRFDHFAPF